MTGGGEREDGKLPEIPKPRFQAAPKAKDSGSKRKPLPRHILKQILDASNARNRWRDPMLLEMQARRRATKPERDKARAARVRELRHLARWPKGRD